MSNYAPVSDAALIELMKLDDQGAFTEIYNRYWHALLHIALQILNDEEAAQDVVQDVFISLWRRRTNLNVLSLRAYLRQAVRFGVLASIRDNKVNDAFYGKLQQLSSEIILDDPLVYKEQKELIERLTATLSDTCAETFRLSREEGLTYKQIANRLEISEKAVEKRMAKSLRHFREGLNWELCISVIFFTTDQL